MKSLILSSIIKVVMTILAIVAIVMAPNIFPVSTYSASELAFEGNGFASNAIFATHSMASVVITIIGAAVIVCMLVSLVFSIYHNWEIIKEYLNLGD
jgi:hypothetical protein